MPLQFVSHGRNTPSFADAQVACAPHPFETMTSYCPASLHAAAAIVNVNEAEAPAREAFEKRRQLLGDANGQTATSLRSYAGVLLGLGRWNEAESLLTDAAERLRKLAGPDDPQRMLALSDLGLVQLRSGRAAEAEQTMRAALDGLRRALGETSDHTLRAQNNLGAILAQTGRPAEANEIFRELLARRRAIMGTTHFQTLLAMHQAAFSLGAQGRADEQAGIEREVLDTLRRCHPYAVDSIDATRSELAVALPPECGAEAVRLAREAYAGRRQRLGERHPSTLQSLNVLADVYLRSGAYADAIEPARDSFELHAQILGDDHPDTLDAQRQFARVRFELGDRRGGIELLEDRERRLRDSAAKPSHFEDGPRWLGNMYRREGRFSDAEQVLVGRFSQLSSARNECDPCVQAIVDELVMLFEEWDAAEPGAGHEHEAADLRLRRK